MMRKYKLATIALLLLLYLMSVYPIVLAAPKTEFTVTGLGTFAGDRSFGYGINDRGQVIGSWGGAAPEPGSPLVTHPFVWSPKNGKIDLPQLADQITGTASSINNFGQIVGFCTTPPSIPLSPSGSIYASHAIIWPSATTVESIEPTSGVYYSVATDINVKGKVVGRTSIIVSQSSGYYTIALGHAFLWTTAGGMSFPIDESSIGATASGANAINDAGQVAGYALALFQHLRTALKA